MFTRSLLRLMFVLMLLLTACEGIGEGFEKPAETIAASLRALRVEFASDPQMLARIDHALALLEQGVKAGFDAETLATLEPFAKELSSIDFKGGLDSETLQRVDILLDKLDRILTIRVDEPTRFLFLKVMEDLKKFPELWRENVALLIPLLGNEIEGMISKAEASATNLISTIGVEGRCNVDFLTIRINDSIPTFVSKNLHAILEKVWKEGEKPDLIPVPAVCHINLTQIDLVRNGETFITTNPVHRISGWDLYQETLPTKFYLRSADRKREFPLSTVRPLQLSLYEFQINLQPADLGQAGAGSTLVFEWEYLEGVEIELPIVFPPDPTPTPSPLPQPTVTFLKENTPIYYYPCTWCWQFAFRNTDDQLRAIALIIPDRIFIKVDVGGTRGYVYVGDVQLNVPLGSLPELVEPPPTPQPPAPAVCSFDATPKEIKQGESALLIWDVENAANVELSFDGKIKKVPEHKRREVSPSQTTTYTLIVTDQNDRPVNCTPGNSVTVTVLETPVPSAPPPPPAPVPAYPSDLVQFFRFENLGSNVDYDTGITTQQYDCGVAGFSTGVALIDSEGVKSSVLDLFAYHHSATNTWWIRADFTTRPYAFSDDTENWDITLLCLNRSYPDLILGWGHNFAPGEYRVDTGISVHDYACGMFGFYIRNGDLNENDAGDILSAYVYDGGGTYHAYLNFRTHGQEPERALSVLCVRRLNADQVILDLIDYHNIGDNPDYLTRYPYDTYVCVPAGYSILDGDMNEKEPDTIIDLNLYMKDRLWAIRGDVHSHHNDENWSVDVLCLSRSMVVGAP